MDRDPRQRTAGSSAQSDSPLYGDWERYTKGIGSKFLQQMGYKPGQGLGKNSDGIVDPVKLQANKGRAMLGLETEEREHRRREKASRYDAKRKGLKYESDEEDEVNSSDEEPPDNAPQFVRDEGKLEARDDDMDGDSPDIIEQQEMAACEALIRRIQDRMQVEAANKSMSQQGFDDLQRDLSQEKDTLGQARFLNNLVQHLETIRRNDKLDIQDFWSFISSKMPSESRCLMIRVFALPLLKNAYNKLTLRYRPKKIDELELERKLFFDMVDVTREWLKTKFSFNILADWYLGWSKTLKSQYSSSRRIEHFRRRMLDVMFLATLRSERDLNSFRYINYETFESEKEANIKEMTSRPDPSLNMNFKSLIEHIASEKGFVFRPISGRRHDARQLYKLDDKTIYIEDKIIFVKDIGHTWYPTTLDDLIERIESS